MMDAQCCDELEFSPEELKEMAQIEEWECEAWEQQKNKLSRFGFVAFMDLLGFSQIAAKDDETAIKRVFAIIKNCRDKAKKKLDEMDLKDMPTNFFLGSQYDDVDISYISDSIVLHRDLPGIALDQNDPDHKLHLGLSGYWFVRLVREMFSDLLREGLPSRCGIAYGNYFWDSDTRSIMAGSALIEAHNASESLAFPGIVGCKSLMDELKDAFEEIHDCTPLENFFVHDFDIPLKGYSNHKVEKGSVVRPNLTFEEVGDSSAFVTKLFTSYGKDVPENFGWNLNAGEKEVLYKRDKSIEVFDRLYQI